jgi:hypothetical protein
MAFKLRTLRRRWGIAAPKLTVRTHVAWYWRALGGIAMLSVSIALALWIYDAGRQFAGFDAAASDSEVARMYRRVAELEEETKTLRTAMATAESRLQIETAAQAQLVKQFKAVEAENARMREDLAFFESLASGRAADKVVVSRFKVENDAMPGEYRYRLLITQGGKDREFQGRLQLIVSMQHAGRDITLVLPDERGLDGTAYRVQFRRFHRVEGSFKVAPDATVRMVQVRLYEQGVAQPRATESFKLS